MDMSLLIPEGDSLVTYYVLPLIGLNKLSFGNCFHASYVDKEGLKVFVELKRNMTSPSYKKNPYYVSQMVFKGKMIIMFTIPSEFIKSCRHFVNGEYSKMSKDAKKLIYSTSSLPYNKNKGSFVMSHPVLQALDTTQTLRSFLINHLGVKTLASSNELINPPYDWWFIEHRIKDEQKV
jgi:hypothetical protein